MSTYIDKKKKYKDVQSTGVTFCLVGGVGIILLLLIDFQLLPLKFVAEQKIMFNVIMGLVFAIFILIGVLSFLSLKKISNEAKDQENTKKDIFKSFIEKYKDQLLKIDESEDEESFFIRTMKIEELLKEEYPDLSDSDLEYYSEEIYDKIYK